MKFLDIDLDFFLDGIPGPAGIFEATTQWGRVFPLAPG